LVYQVLGIPNTWYTKYLASKYQEGYTPSGQMARSPPRARGGMHPSGQIARPPPPGGGGGGTPFSKGFEARLLYIEFSIECKQVPQQRLSFPMQATVNMRISCHRCFQARRSHAAVPHTHTRYTQGPTIGWGRS
jgi:hypothetical protein